MNLTRYFTLALSGFAGCGLALAFAPLYTAHGQSQLVSAVPAPDSVIALPPKEVRLVFDQPLLEQGMTLAIADANEQLVQRITPKIDPANRFALVAKLPVLVEGEYTISYSVATVGSSTLLVGSYTFTLDLPDPVLELVVPANGQVFEQGPMPIRLNMRFVDFNLYNTRVRLYVDGQLRQEWIGLRTMIEGLAPGVHEIRVVLARFDNEELPETSTTVHIAIARSDPELAAQVVSPPSYGSLSSRTPLQIAGLIALAVTALGLGMWIGRSTP